jgi:uncharacterized protein YgbK (DUF1537 family)
VFTSGKLVTVADAECSLAIGQRVSDSLIAIVRGIQTQPRFVLTKEGITSSDVATKGLGTKTTLASGQILPGVPVWRCGPESRYPGVANIVFPGNVGDEKALVEVARMADLP